MRPASSKTVGLRSPCGADLDLLLLNTFRSVLTCLKLLINTETTEGLGLWIGEGIIKIRCGPQTLQFRFVCSCPFGCCSRHSSGSSGGIPESTTRVRWTQA